ncbi:amino acid adenylation domain-containing protein [Pseudoduganella sp. LjRoot289]|uniref:amino acid adenylation domain-containing protein n=1 Tax=Pseudoduganella sp. LjRoot289 TaxID=3342314 RepID=UPI003ECDA283
MKSLIIGVSGTDGLATKAMVALFELGHEVLVLPGSGEQFLEIAASLGVAVLTRDAAAHMPPLDALLLLAEGAAAPAWLQQPCHEVRCGISLDAARGQTGELAWSIGPATAMRTLCSTTFTVGGQRSGADLAAGVTQLALDLLMEAVGHAAQHNGVWGVQAASAATARCDAASMLETLAFCHQSNRPARPGAPQGSLFAQFADAATAHPRHTALVAPDATLSYQELFDYAAAIAEDLLQRGLAPQDGAETVIGVAMPKSARLYATILAVVGIGAAYVPLDPAYPAPRLAAVAEDAALAQVLTDAEHAATFERLGLQTIQVVPYQPGVCAGPAAPSPFARAAQQHQPQRLATVIYTSGSTGRPKGVMLEHRNIAAFCHWYRGHVGLTAVSRALQFSTISFDASLLDIFPTLFAGGCVIAPSEQQRHDFSALDELVRAHGVTHAFLPPALLAGLPDFAWPALQHLVTGGDVCDPDTIGRWKRGRQFHNIYGPTECTVLATTSNFSLDSANKNIGQPIAGARCYVLDDNRKPVRGGEQGELYIAGAGVGRGYFRQAALTGERFLADPLEHGASMYRSGDIVTWRADGGIEFIGRKDFQVKIRGFRVELGEIENAVLACALFKHCAVVVDEQKRILAFVAKPCHAAANAADVKAGVRQRLPDYMVPFQVTVLPALPATDNGKTDRRALLALAAPAARDAVEETLSATESRLRPIWAAVLQLDETEIGKTDSFFDLGGHSLLVSRMLLAIKKEWAVSTPLARFMEQPTIAALALLLTDDTIRKGDSIPEQVYTDMLLPVSVAPMPAANPALHAPRAVLLTGANGFLGVFLLQQILQQTDAVVHCLIRAATPEQGSRKLGAALAANGLQALAGQARIRIVLGDLEQPGLGLPAQLFDELAQQVDVIYHNGANVNHVYDYRYLANANVRSTLELLRLATTGKNKALHYISTLSAASNVDAAGRIVEDGPARTPPAFVNNGYNLSKWVSEHLVWQAIGRGLTGTIIRPGNISGHTQTGVCQPDQNRIMLLIKGSVQLGCAPAWDSGFDLCPVDFLAEAAVRCSLSARLDTPVLHFHNPKPLDWVDYLACWRGFGYPLALVAPDEWRRRIVEVDESNALYNVLSFYLDESNEDIGDMSHIDHLRTEAALARLGMAFPDKSAAMIENNLRYLQDSGFMPQLPIEADG